MQSYSAVSHRPAGWGGMGRDDRAVAGRWGRGDPACSGCGHLAGEVSGNRWETIGNVLRIHAEDLLGIGG